MELTCIVRTVGPEVLRVKDKGLKIKYVKNDFGEREQKVNIER